MALDPAIVASIDDLEFAARRIVESARVGMHRSPLHGFNAEFHQYRAYRPGDDLRHLDWKLLARTDRLYTRQFRETTSLDAMIVVDASASMNYGTPSKYRSAVALAAALAWVISSQGDGAGVLAGGATPLLLPPRRGRAHLRSLLMKLSTLEPGGAAPVAELTRRASAMIRRRGALIVISDFYDDEARSRQEMARAVRQGHDVTMLQTMAPDELHLPLRGTVRVADLENGSEIDVDATAAQREYDAAVAAFVERTRSLAGSLGIDYHLALTSTAPDELLRRYLLKR